MDITYNHYMCIYRSVKLIKCSHGDILTLHMITFLMFGYPIFLEMLGHLSVITINTAYNIGGGGVVLYYM